MNSGYFSRDLRPPHSAAEHDSRHGHHRPSSKHRHTRARTACSRTKPARRVPSEVPTVTCKCASLRSPISARQACGGCGFAILLVPRVGSPSLRRSPSTLVPRFGSLRRSLAVAIRPRSATPSNVASRQHVPQPRRARLATASLPFTVAVRGSFLCKGLSGFTGWLRHYVSASRARISGGVRKPI